MAGYKDDKSKVPTEAELEAMLDSESDEDFGQTEQPYLPLQEPKYSEL